MGSGLLVSHEDMLDVWILQDGVIERKNGSTRITEDMLDSITFENFK